MNLSPNDRSILCYLSIRHSRKMSKSTSSWSIKSEVDSDSVNKLSGKYSTWGKHEIQELLSRQLKSRRAFKQEIFKEWPDKSKTRNPRLGTTLRSGLYSIPLLKDCLKNGTPEQSIAKAMKHGLVSLNPWELEYLKDLGVEACVLQNENLWQKSLDERLIENLWLVKLKEKECWNIIINGLVQQDSETLSHLVLSGIDVAGILNWQDPSKEVPSRVVEFLRCTGIDETIIQLVEQYGIDDECLELLNNLVDSDICKENTESKEIICKCCSKLGKLSKAESSTSSVNLHSLHSLQYFLKKFIPSSPSQSSVDLTTERNNYLRQNVMIALTWAMARTLHYRPSDPQYYLAYQLLRWSHGTVSQAEKRKAYKFVTSATKRMDFKLAVSRKLYYNCNSCLLLLYRKVESLSECEDIHYHWHCKQMKKMHEEEEARIKEAQENIPCEECMNRDEVIRKEGCPSCRKAAKKVEACSLPELCSACKLPAEKASKKIVCDFPEFCSFCRLSDHDKVSSTEVCEFPEVCSACKLEVATNEENETEVCSLAKLCSRCRL